MNPIAPISVLSRIQQNTSLGLTPFQNQIDGLVGNFTDQATDGKTLAAMTVGGLAYRLGKIGVMALGQSPLLRPLSLIFGLGTEVTAFEFTNRVLNSFPDRAGLKPAPTANLWRWEVPTGWKQGFLSSATTFGILKGAGHLAQGQNLILQHLFQDVAMVTGHQVLGALGVNPKPEGTLADQLVHAEATNIQMQGGMGLVHGMSPGLMAMEIGLDISLQSREISLKSKWKNLFSPLVPSLAMDFALSIGSQKGSSRFSPIHLSVKMGEEGKKIEGRIKTLSGSEENPGNQAPEFPHQHNIISSYYGVLLETELVSKEPVHNLPRMSQTMRESLLDILVGGRETYIPLKGELAQRLRESKELRSEILGENRKVVIRMEAESGKILSLQIYEGDSLKVQLTEGPQGPPAELKTTPTPASTTFPVTKKPGPDKEEKETSPSKPEDIPSPPSQEIPWRNIKNRIRRLRVKILDDSTSNNPSLKRSLTILLKQLLTAHAQGIEGGSVIKVLEAIRAGFEEKEPTLDKAWELWGTVVGRKPKRRMSAKETPPQAEVGRDLRLITDHPEKKTSNPLKLSPLQNAVLEALKASGREMQGSQIIRTLRDAKIPFASTWSVYGALHRIERKGLVRSRTEPSLQKGFPPLRFYKLEVPSNIKTDAFADVPSKEPKSLKPEGLRHEVLKIFSEEKKEMQGGAVIRTLRQKIPQPIVFQSVYRILQGLEMEGTLKSRTETNPHTPNFPPFKFYRLKDKTPAGERGTEGGPPPPATPLKTPGGALGAVEKVETVSADTTHSPITRPLIDHHPEILTRLHRHLSPSYYFLKFQANPELLAKIGIPQNSIQKETAHIILEDLKTRAQALRLHTITDLNDWIRIHANFVSIFYLDPKPEERKDFFKMALLRDWLSYVPSLTWAGLPPEPTPPNEGEKEGAMVRETSPSDLDLPSNSTESASLDKAILNYLAEDMNWRELTESIMRKCFPNFFESPKSNLPMPFYSLISNFAEQLTGSTQISLNDAGVLQRSMYLIFKELGREAAPFFNYSNWSNKRKLQGIINEALEEVRTKQAIASPTKEPYVHQKLAQQDEKKFRGRDIDSTLLSEERDLPSASEVRALVKTEGPDILLRFLKKAKEPSNPESWKNFTLLYELASQKIPGALEAIFEVGRANLFHRFSEIVLSHLEQLTDLGIPDALKYFQDLSALLASAYAVEYPDPNPQKMAELFSNYCGFEIEAKAVSAAILRLGLAKEDDYKVLTLQRVPGAWKGAVQPANDRKKINFAVQLNPVKIWNPSRQQMEESAAPIFLTWKSFEQQMHTPNVGISAGNPERGKYLSPSSGGSGKK